MIVGYNLKHSIGDTIVDLARKNDRYGMLTGLEELLKPVLAAPAPSLSGGPSGSSAQGPPPLDLRLQQALAEHPAPLVAAPAGAAASSDP